MSFGFSISDFVTVPAFAWKVYTSCKESSQSYKDLSGEVCSLHIVLREVEEYVSRYPLEGDGERRLLEVGKGCHDVLKDLEGVLERYESLGTHSQRTWDRMRWGLEDVSRIRERLISNTALLTALNTTLSRSLFPTTLIRITTIHLAANQKNDIAAHQLLGSHGN